jgi:Ca2+/H+ antiporter, TMEM165/GDT1 family
MRRVGAGSRERSRRTAREVASPSSIGCGVHSYETAQQFPIGVGVTAAAWAVLVATYVACVVEAVEATTIIMAMGFTRSWRSTWLGVATALVALGVVAAIFGYALTSWLPEAALQLVIGGLLLVFGLQWLRKAILRASHRKSVHDEGKIFREQQETARTAGDQPDGFDMFAFMVSLKGTFLEGMEVVFIVITFGLNAHNVPAAVFGAVAAVITVTILALSFRKPLAMIPENTMKYGVGLLLASFGTFWAIEGLGVFRSGQESIAWPGSDAAVLVLLVVWFVVTRGFIAALSRSRANAPQPTRVRAERSVE